MASNGGILDPDDLIADVVDDREQVSYVQRRGVACNTGHVSIRWDLHSDG